MPFGTGQSGHPAGRAPGSRNQATLALEAMFDAQAEALVHGIIDRAVGGHPAVEGLTRTAASIDIVKEHARQEVARAAARLGIEHFFAGSSAARPYDDTAPDGPETDAGL